MFGGDRFSESQFVGSALRAWISQGIDPALFASPIEGTIAEFFSKHQDIGMPIFGTLPESDIQILTDYVIILNAFGEMDAKAIRRYGRLTQQL